jgi:hypothetical protein
LQIAQLSVIDLSQLAAINITIDCIGYAVQGGGAAIAPRELRPEVRSIRSTALLLCSAAGASQAG